MKAFTVEEVKTELLKYHKVLTGWMVDQNLLFTAFPFMGNDDVEENLEKFVKWLNEAQQQVRVEPEVILEAGEKETQENIKKYILEAEAKGEIVINTGDSLDNYNVDYFIQQPIESILYDLNRDRITILTFIKDEKWINDFACMKVIEAMKARLSK